MDLLKKLSEQAQQHSGSQTSSQHTQSNSQSQPQNGGGLMGMIGTALEGQLQNQSHQPQHGQTSNEETGGSGGLMNKISGALAGQHQPSSSQDHPSQSSGQGGLMGKINDAMGGGQKGENKEGTSHLESFFDV